LSPWILREFKPASPLLVAFHQFKVLTTCFAWLADPDFGQAIWDAQNSGASGKSVINPAKRLGEHQALANAREALKWAAGFHASDEEFCKSVLVSAQQRVRAKLPPSKSDILRRSEPHHGVPGQRLCVRVCESSNHRIDSLVFADHPGEFHLRFGANVKLTQVAGNQQRPQSNATPRGRQSHQRDKQSEGAPR
jgi:hypothetical protein